MDGIELLKGFATAATVIAAVLVAANLSPRLMVSGFAIFVATWLGWIVGAGSLQDDP